MATRLTHSPSNFIRDFLTGSEDSMNVFRYLLPVAIVGFAVVLYESRRLQMTHDLRADAIQAASESKAEATRALTDLVNIYPEAMTALGQVHDATSAEAARKQLESFNPLIEKAQTIWAQVPEPFRQRFRAPAADALDKLQLTVDRVVAQPGVGEVLKEPAEQLLIRLRPFT